MKRIYVNENWCLGCHLCEYYCAFANSGNNDMVKALKGKIINPRIKVEEGGDICFEGVNFNTFYVKGLFSLLERIN